MIPTRTIKLIALVVVGYLLVRWIQKKNAGGSKSEAPWVDYTGVTGGGTWV